VDAINFIAQSRASKEALKSANLLKTLTLNALIEGPVGVGKLTLAQYIVPRAIIIDGFEFNSIDLKSIESKEIIIKNFDTISNVSKLESFINEKAIRVIATTTKILSDDIFDRFFAVKIHIPSLQDRKEDISLLTSRFLQEAKEVFGDNQNRNSNLNINHDLSSNGNSLKRSVFISYLIDNLSENEILNILENYLYKNINGNNDYRDFLYLYEIPLLKSAIKKYKSQLQVADKLGLNRNTLRKKINELKDIL